MLLDSFCILILASMDWQFSLTLSSLNTYFSSPSLWGLNWDRQDNTTWKLLVRNMRATKKFRCKEEGDSRWIKALNQSETASAHTRACARILGKTNNTSKQRLAGSPDPAGDWGVIQLTPLIYKQTTAVKRCLFHEFHVHEFRQVAARPHKDRDRPDQTIPSFLGARRLAARRPTCCHLQMAEAERILTDYYLYSLSSLLFYWHL